MANTRRARRAGLFLLVGAVGLSSLGCAGTTISRILAEPQKYTRQGDVGLNGNVLESMSFLGHGAYKLDDGTGTIWVISNHGVPRKGARVKVNGSIRDVVDISTIIKLPEQIGSGLVMTEDQPPRPLSRGRGARSATGACAGRRAARAPPSAASAARPDEILERRPLGRARGRPPVLRRPRGRARARPHDAQRLRDQRLRRPPAVREREDVDVVAVLAQRLHAARRARARATMPMKRVLLRARHVVVVDVEGEAGRVGRDGDARRVRVGLPELALVCLRADQRGDGQRAAEAARDSARPAPGAGRGPAGGGS